MLSLIKQLTSFLDTIGHGVLKLVPYFLKVKRFALPWLKKTLTWMRINIVAFLDWLGQIVINLVSLIVRKLNHSPWGTSKFSKALIRLWRKRHRKNRPVLWGAVSLLIILSPVAMLTLKNATLTEAAWYDGSWQYRKQLTFDNSAQSEDLSDFPVMVKLTSSNFSFSRAQSSGEDLRFTDSNGTTLLSYEIESFDPSSETAVIWVNIPQIDGSSSSDSIYLYYGNPTASDTQSADNTWNSNYKGVYHLSDNASSTTVTDSSGNTNTLATSNNTSAHSYSAGQIASAFTTMGTPHSLPNQDGSNIEYYPSVQLDSNSFPVISMMDGTDGDLILVHCNDRQCIGDDESVEVVDTSGWTGYYTDLELDSSGYPVITYWDNTNNDLKLVHCDDANCSGTETPVTLDSSGAVGRYASLELDSSGYPVIAYWDDSNDDLKLIHCSDANCSSYSTQVVDSSMDTNYYHHSIALKLDSSGYPVIVYIDWGAKQLEITHCNDANCAGGDETHNAIIDSGYQHRYVDFELDSSGYPMIVEYDHTNLDVFYIHCDDANCSGTETPVTLDTNYNYWPKIELSDAGNPIVYATRWGAYPYLIVCADAECSSKSGNYLTLYNQSGPIYSTMVLDENDYPVITEYARGNNGRYDANIYRLDPKINQSYDSDFDFGTGDFSISMWFKSDAAKENYLLSRYDNDQGFKIWLDYAGHPSFGIDDDSSFGPDDNATQLASGFSANVDSNQAGYARYPSMELDSSGYPVIAYFDDDSDDLEIVHCNDVDCAGSNENTAQIDSTGDVGRFPSLKLDTSGYPVIAYHDNTNQDLKVVHCGDANCSSGNTINTIDSTGNVGDYPTLQLDSSGYPVIAYYDATNTAIKLVHCNDANCSGSDESIVTVDNSEDDRAYNAYEWMQLDSNGYPVMAYTKVTGWDLKLAHCNDANCTGGDESITTVLSSGNLGLHTSLELDSSGYPVIAHNQDWNYTKLTHCNDANCVGGDETTNTVTDLEEFGEAGYWNIDLEINSSGNPVLIEADLSSHQTILTVCNDADCSGGDETYSKISDDQFTRYHTSLVLDSNSYPVIAVSRNDYDLALLHLDSNTYTDTNRYDDDEWHHLVAVKDDTSSIRLYIDGSEYATDTSLAATGTLTSNSAEMRLAETITQIGGIDFSTYQWGGNIDEVQIDSTARSADWVAAQYLSESNSFITYNSLQTNPKGDNPIAHWKFDEGYGTTANDAVGSNNGTITSATWVSEDLCVSGKCLSFTSTNYVNIADPSDDSLDFGTGDFTIQTWIKTGTSADHRNLFRKGAGDGTYGWRFGLLSGIPNVLIGDSSHSSGNLGSTSIADNEWHHLSVVYDRSGNAIGYIDGKQVGTLDISARSGDIGNSSAVIIGNSFETFTGFLDEPKIYPYARSAAQIKTDYNARGGTSNGTSVMLGANKGNDPALSNGLVGYWKMDETASPALDSSGNGNSGTWAGDTTSAAGKFGNSITSDGSGDYISVSAMSSLPNEQITISTWVYLDTHKNWNNIVWHEWVNDGWLLYTDSSGNARFGIGQSSAQYNSGAVAISTGEWAHLVGTYDGEKVIVYVNGVAGSATTLSGATLDNDGDVRISNGTTSSTAGDIDETRIYNRALSPVEVRKLYNWAPGPVGHWKMDEGTGTTANDISGNGNNASFTGTPLWENGKFGGGLHFDGSSNYINAGNDDSLNPSHAVTIGSWVKLDTAISTQASAYPQIVGKRDVDLQRAYFLAFNKSTSKLYWEIKDNAGTYFSVSSDKTDWDIDKWYYISATFDGSSSSNNFKIYVDGVLDIQATRTLTYVPQTTATTRIGGGGSYYLDGSLDDVRIYDYARTSGQIIEDMNAGHPLGGSPISSKIGHWKFDKGYGTTAHNSGYGGSALDGTITASLWKNEGKIGKTLSFDGATSKVEVPTFDHEIDQQYTLSTWINYSSGQATYMSKETTWDNGFKFWDSAGTLAFRAGDGTNVANLFASIPTGASNNTWFHMAVTRNSDTWKLYIDGVLKSTATNATIGDTNNSGALKIGNRETGSWDPEFQGMLDEVKIYSAALTAEEILIDMNQGSAMALGSLSDTSGLTGGSVASSSASSAYCIPGDTSSCSPPVGEWKFEEKTGTTAYDTSGNGNTGTITEATWVNGEIGSALDFDGSNDYINVGQGDSLDDISNITLSAWIKPSSFTTSYRSGIISRRNSTGLNFDITGDLDGGAGKIEVVEGGGSSVIGSTTLQVGQWYYVTATLEGTSVKLYVNGILDGTGTLSWTWNNSTDIYIGGIQQIANYYHDGAIDDVRIYDYARTPAQVAYDYNRGAPVGHYKLDECQGTTAYDSSGNDNHGTITIGATGTNTTAGTCTTSGAWYDGVTGKLNSSLDFDGTDDYITVPHASNIDFDDTQSFSISLWMKQIDTITNFGRLFEKRDGATTGYGCYSHSMENYLRCNLADGSDHAFSFNDVTSFDGSWHHVVLIVNRDTDIASAYMDGVKSTYTSDISSVGSLVNSEDLTLGRALASNPYRGQIDDVQIFNYALTPQQVKQVMNQSSAIRFGPSTGQP